MHLESVPYTSTLTIEIQKLFLIAIAALIFTLPSLAATRTVTKTADTGDGVCDADCSLREAITGAANGDTITFASPLFDAAQTITLTTDTEIRITASISVVGPGADKLTVDGGPGNNRIFDVPSAAVTLSGMTLTGGNGVGASETSRTKLSFVC